MNLDFSLGLCFLPVADESPKHRFLDLFLPFVPPDAGKKAISELDGAALNFNGEDFI